MAKFLNTSATNYFLEELIKDAKDQLKISSKLTRKLGLKTGDFLDRMVAKGHLELKDGKQVLTDAGKAAGGELRVSPRFGAYFLWPEAMDA